MTSASRTGHGRSDRPHGGGRPLGPAATGGDERSRYGSPDRMRLAIALGVFVGYVAVARAVQDLYPFSVFEMFADTMTSSSRLVARLPDGNAAEVERFVHWQCDEPIDEDPVRCGPLGSFGYTPYRDRELADWVRRHERRDDAPGGAEALELTRRIYRVTGVPGPLSVEDCVLASCRAVRR
jgi:hypothetical protein